MRCKRAHDSWINGRELVQLGHVYVDVRFNIVF